MAGLSHFLNSKASTNYYEPFYKNLFEVTILPPPGISGGELLLEHVKTIGGLETDKGSDMIEQTYKRAKRSFQSGIPTGTTVDLAIAFSLNLNDSNEMYVYKTLRDRWRAARNPMTGEQGIKKYYYGQIVVTNHTRKGDIFWQRTFNSCIPMGNIPTFDGDYSAGDAHEMSVTFRSDYWEENIV